ncbi:DNA polymerase zeta catalytic subunit [Heterostelium album PN500]|uniref:DNA polymerase zeta catalytic subunit n=1 Tax=Heterostelium pallidum (strain ATCC 26659 / Pp 5 / PN500) TaxID=670386 RepID=D3B1B4_HETP5|nr:DNA polymerase zeta catalytic subunit [Heterostelium album PN500]EFA85088.1 DNA polymerase zeta catalytic subunit [Heterostelium album PN500]|eukprot:XP_020437197.1 DNA polymerase zeta catalytic subunit [Heterostelium album PN500]
MFESKKFNHTPTKLKLPGAGSHHSNSDSRYSNSYISRRRERSGWDISESEKQDLNKNNKKNNNSNSNNSISSSTKSNNRNSTSIVISSNNNNSKTNNSRYSTFSIGVELPIEGHIVGEKEKSEEVPEIENNHKENKLKDNNNNNKNSQDKEKEDKEIEEKEIEDKETEGKVKKEEEQEEEEGEKEEGLLSESDNEHNNNSAIEFHRESDADKIQDSKSLNDKNQDSYLDNQHQKVEEQEQEHTIEIDNNIESFSLMTDDSIETIEDQKAPVSKRLKSDHIESNHRVNNNNNNNKSNDVIMKDNNSSNSKNDDNNSSSSSSSNSSNKSSLNKKNNIVEDTKQLIEDNYDENLVSTCTFCKQKIKQIQWIQHIKRCLNVAIELTHDASPNVQPIDNESRKVLLEFQSELSQLKRKLSDVCQPNNNNNNNKTASAIVNTSLLASSGTTTPPLPTSTSQTGYYSGIPTTSPTSATTATTATNNSSSSSQQQQTINPYSDKQTQASLDRRKHQDFVLDMCLNRPHPAVCAIVVFGDIHIRICHAQHFQNDEFTERFKKAYSAAKDTDTVSPKCYSCKSFMALKAPTIPAAAAVLPASLPIPPQLQQQQLQQPPHQQQQPQQYPLQQHHNQQIQQQHQQQFLNQLQQQMNSMSNTSPYHNNNNSTSPTVGLPAVPLYKSNPSVTPPGHNMYSSNQKTIYQQQQQPQQQPQSHITSSYDSYINGECHISRLFLVYDGDSGL